MLFLQILVGVILAVQVFIAIYFPKLYGKRIEAPNAKSYYEKYGGEGVENKCGGIWGEKGSKTYQKYYNIGVYNGVILNLMIFAALGVYIS